MVAVVAGAALAIAWRSGAPSWVPTRYLPHSIVGLSLAASLPFGALIYRQSLKDGRAALVEALPSADQQISSKRVAQLFCEHTDVANDRHPQEERADHLYVACLMHHVGGDVDRLGFLSLTDEQKRSADALYQALVYFDLDGSF